MLVEYVRFVQAIFPSITPGAAKQLIDAAGVAGFAEQEYFSTQLGTKLCQGDVVEGLRWPVQRPDGRYGIASRGGMLLSVSCDVDHASWLMFAVVNRFDASLGNASEIKRQGITELYYLPAHGVRPACVADLSQVQSFRADYVLDGIAGGTMRRVDMLSKLGYWHFLAKLTIHLMRPQTSDEVRFPLMPGRLERARYALTSAVGMVRYVAVGRSS